MRTPFPRRRHPADDGGRHGAAGLRRTGVLRRLRRSPRTAVAAAVAAAGIGFGVANLPAFADTTAPTIPANATAPDGARVVSENQIDSRTLELGISSPALATVGYVRLLLPPGYSQDATRSWPVLYLLSGCCDANDQQDWMGFTDVEKFTDGKQAIIVMPSDGKGGSYSNWYNYGRGGAPRWADFHLKEMMPILEKAYHVSSTDRVAAGLSLGGFGAVLYAEQNPGMFKAVASYSGSMDTQAQPMSVLETQMSSGLDPFALWGSPWLNANIWSAHNPIKLIGNLKGTGTKIFLSSGNGHLGPLDPPTDKWNWKLQLAEVSEANTLPQNQEFAAAAQADGLDITTDFYGAGTHSWAYWQQEFHRSWPMLASALGIPA